MTVTRRIKNLVKKLMNIHISWYLPRGVDLSKDITNHLPMLVIDVIFDVGANVGQAVMKYQKKF